ENPVIPEPNHVEDAHDPNEMVDIPDDEDLVDYDGDDEEPEEEPEEEPKQKLGMEIIIEDLSTRLGNLEYRHEVLMRKMDEVSDAEVADSIAIGEIHPRVATIREQVYLIESQAVQVVSGLKEIEARVQQVENRVDTYSSGQMAVPRQDEIIGLSQQVQTLHTTLHGIELQNQQLRTRVAEMESHVGILMSYMLWMEERLTVLEKRLLGPPPGPSSHFLSFLTLLV
nr:hypothetical protein [Tanacetum cinerariifolium]